MSTKPVLSRRSRADSRAHILDSAQALLVEEGVDRLKLTAVAAAAGVSHPNVLHHFGSIGDLHAALMERMILDLVGKLMAIAATASQDAPDPLAGLGALFDAFEAPGAARLAAWLEISGEHRKMGAVRETIKTIVADNMVPFGWEAKAAEELVLLATTLALGVGLFGNSLAEHFGQPSGAARALALQLLAQAFDQRSPGHQAARPT